jgi:hypothetical protein
MVQPPVGRTPTDVERAIEAEFGNRPPAEEAKPTTGAPETAMPDHVEHRDDATGVGTLSAEAVIREYRTAEKEIEATGALLIDLVKQCEAMTGSALAVAGQLKETAGHYRQEAKRVFLQIENCSQVTAEVRRTCTELREKIASPGKDAAETSTGQATH